MRGDTGTVVINGEPLLVIRCQYCQVTINSSGGRKALISVASSIACFGLGILVLRLNPYWRIEPGEPGTLHHRVYAWNGVGHLLCGIGLFSLAVIILFCISCAFRTKWPYWVLVGCGIVVCTATLGSFAQAYQTEFVWDREAGLSRFRIQDCGNQTYLWQALVRWQVQDELRGYLKASDLIQADGRVSITVLRIIPVAVPTALGSGGQSFTRQVWKKH